MSAPAWIFLSEAGSHKQFDERSTSLQGGFRILGRMGIYHGPPSCQLETVLAKASARQNVVNTQTPKPLKPLKP